MEMIIAPIFILHLAFYSGNNKSIWVVLILCYIAELLCIADISEYLELKIRRKLGKKVRAHKEHICGVNAGIFYGMACLLENVINTWQTEMSSTFDLWESYGLFEGGIEIFATLCCCFCFGSSVARMLEERNKNMP